VFFKSGLVSVATIRALLDACNALRDRHDASAWKMNIEAIIKDKLKSISSKAEKA